MRDFTRSPAFGEIILPVKTHDTLLVYASRYGKYLYNRQFTPYGEKCLKWFKHEDGKGRKYRTRSRKGRVFRQYLDESPGMPLSTVWSDIMQLSSRRGQIEMNMQFDYLEAMTLFRVGVRNGLSGAHALLGPVLGVNLSCDANARIAQLFVNADCGELGFSPQRVDLGVAGGVGFAVGLGGGTALLVDMCCIRSGCWTSPAGTVPTNQTTNQHPRPKQNTVKPPCS